MITSWRLTFQTFTLLILLGSNVTTVQCKVFAAARIRVKTEHQLFDAEFNDF